MELPATTSERLSVEEYLRREAHSVDKHEYRNGRAIAMAGGTPEHSLIMTNLIGELRNRLKGSPCKVYESNLRMRIPRTPIYTYPDLSVICGPIQLDPKDPTGTTATNPRVVVEVLSPTTEGYDRGEKFRRYLTIDSLEEYVLVSRAIPRIETFFRQDGGAWLFTHWVGLDATATIRSLRIEVPLSEVYAGIEFPPDDAAAADPSSPASPI
jgi:Uma2 family endonuclease